MKKATLLLFPAALALWAADVWQTKPFTEWNEKDIVKIMTDSPWSKKVSVTLDSGRGPAVGSSSGGGGGKGGGRGGPQGGKDSGVGDGGAPETVLFVRWRTALPLNEALAKNKYGAEAGTSPDAKKMLEPEPNFYVIWIAGLPASMRPSDDAAKQELMKQSVLSPKDKNSIPVADIQFAGQGRASDFFFVFPKTTALTTDDKEVEFATKFGKTAIKAKFRLKDMEINGKLDL